MIQDKTVLAIIPARGGSKGVPNKTFRQINGQSLLAHTIEKAKKSLYIDRLIVSSEDRNILDAAHLAGADIPFIRPAELAQDETPGTLPILHALNQLPPFDYVVVLQVTSPLRITSDIDECLHLCFTQNAPCCVSVSEADSSPYWMFAINDAHLLSPLLSGATPTQRQKLPITYMLNGAVYTAKSSWFQQHKSFLSNETIGYVMPKERSLDIDTEFDFKLLDLYLAESTAHEK